MRLDAGHAVIHRGFSPKKEHLDTALDVMEGILAALYVHEQNVNGLQIPDRPRQGANPVGPGIFRSGKQV